MGALGLIGFNVYADALARDYVHAVAPLELPQTNVGLAWQRAAFGAKDLLPIYGSSELNPQPFEGASNGSTFFKYYPTGFTILPVGKPGTTCLIMLQDLAALDGLVRGKKVVISISPPWFTRPNASALRQDQYAGNFSPLHAYSFLFNSNVSENLKRRAAKRMLVYRSSYSEDSLLRFALEQWAANTPLSRALLAAVTPLGKLAAFTLEQQDKFEAVRAVWEHPEWQTQPERRPAALDWPAILERTSKLAEEDANNNPYGFYNYFWTTRGSRVLNDKAKRRIEEFLQTVRTSPDWKDCDLLLSALQEMGANVLVLSQPMKGAYYTAIGVNYAARRQFYLRQQQLVARYRMPLIDFADHDDDLLFVVDPYSHLSAKGWAYYDRALDAFYHDTLTAK